MKSPAEGKSDEAAEQIEACCCTTQTLEAGRTNSPRRRRSACCSLAARDLVFRGRSPAHSLTSSGLQSTSDQPPSTSSQQLPSVLLFSTSLFTLRNYDRCARLCFNCDLRYCPKLWTIIPTNPPRGLYLSSASAHCKQRQSPGFQTSSDYLPPRVSKGSSLPETFACHHTNHNWARRFRFGDHRNSGLTPSLAVAESGGNCLAQCARGTLDIGVWTIFTVKGKTYHGTGGS